MLKEVKSGHCPRGRLYLIKTFMWNLMSKSKNREHCWSGDNCWNMDWRGRNGQKWGGVSKSFKGDGLSEEGKVLVNKVSEMNEGQWKHRSGGTDISSYILDRLSDMHVFLKRYLPSSCFLNFQEWKYISNFFFLNLE